MKKEKNERTELEIINFMTGVVLVTIYSEAKYKTIKKQVKSAYLLMLSSV